MGSEIFLVEFDYATDPGKIEREKWLYVEIFKSILAVR